MFYPIKVYSGKELEDYTKESGDIMSSKVRKNKKGKIISPKQLDKEYWNEFEKQEKILKDLSVGVVDVKQPAVPYNDVYYE